MRKKSIFKLLTIMIGVILISLSFNQVQASEITSVFSGEVVSRQTLKTLAIDNELDTKIVPIKLGIQQSEYKTNGGNTYWVIKDTKGVNKDLYCLNLLRGFGNPDGIITAANSTKNYLSEYNLKELTDSNYEKYTGLSTTTKNKILWILNNSLTSKQDLKDILTLASSKVEENNIKDFVQEDMILNNRESTKLTFEDIKMVQQIAIWHYTNPGSVFDSTINGICNSEGKQISGLMEENIDIDGFRVNYVWNGRIKQLKLNALYDYFIDGAESGNSGIVEPELTLSNKNAVVTETSENYVVGPFVLGGENKELVKEIIPTVNVNYTLLNSSKVAVEDNDFTKIVGNSGFYLQIPKSEINETTQISINLKYTYNGKEIVLLTDKDDYLNTQPVALIENVNLDSEVTTNTQIELTQVKVNKVWEDNDNQDGKRPQSITVNLLADGKVIDTKVISENSEGKWEYTFTELLKYSSGKEVKYTVTENKVDKYTTQINGYTIKNIYNPETIEKTVTKVWDDNNNQDGKRAEYGVTLKANGVVYGEEVKLKANQLSYTWENLPKYENGEEIVYTVEETTIPNGYSATYSEDTFIITNKYTPGKVNLKVIKEWQDENDKDGIRPDYVVVKLLKTIENEKIEVSRQRLDENNNWMYIWTGLDEKNEGKDILYSIEEISGEGYTTTYSATNFENTNEITITNTHIPVVITGKYDVVLRKVDEKGNVLIGSKFKVNGTEYDLSSTGEVKIYENQQITSTDDINFTFILDETVVPSGYIELDDAEVNIKARVEEDDENYKIIRVNLTDGEGNNITDENINVKLEGEAIVIEVKNTPIEKQFDLALRKFITKVNDIEYSREPIVDTSKLETAVDGKTVTTATYKHSKQPIAVQKGDVVTYTIRVYNEGEVDGYVDKITDYLPNNLIPIIHGIKGIDTKVYEKEIEFNSNWLWSYAEDERTITTTITSKLNTETYSVLTGLEEVADTKLNAYVEGSNRLDYIDVQIKCLVADSAVSYEYLTNIAEIVESQDINGNKTDGADSKLGNVDHTNLSDYKNNDAISSTKESYIVGQEDDDDFEKLVVREFDLALRKFITKVNEVMHVRTPIVDTSKLGTTVDGKTITTATYTHTKQPVIVKTGDIVTYTIRIFNEGTISGFANEITDDMPKGLEFLPEDDLNKQYGWKMLDKDGNQTENIANAVLLVTDYLSDKNEENIIQAVKEENGVKTLDYKDVEIRFKVVAKAEKLKDNLIINEAQISADSDRDIDSIPNRDEKYDYTTGKNEDDIDYEPIKLQYFDLALRKFITKVNTTDYNNRYPEVIYGADGSISYNHTKDPVLVTTGDIVTYTIRIYNEGEIAGYATGVKDNLPEGLAFDPENETNKQYGWKMLDKDGNNTEDIEKVVAFSTDYLKDQLIEALVVENGAKVLSYKDVKIAFKVTEPNTSDRVLVNTAQILEDSNDDVDSVPGNDVLTEDDIDREYVRVQYFDLSLKKWVTKTQVTYNGKTTTTKTGFTEDSEDIAKVDLVAKQMTKTTVKFAYNIKVTNEGELPGYATEIKDYIPKGLKFVAEDNKDWKEIKDGVVVTDKLKDTLLNPGESATVEIVLTWKNSTTNTGLKTNYAEISADSAEDKDSIPDNYDFTEDDIDDAQVILSIKTAGPTTYIGLVLGTVAILAGGIFLIKKYVLD